MIFPTHSSPYLIDDDVSAVVELYHVLQYLCTGQSTDAEQADVGRQLCTVRQHHLAGERGVTTSPGGGTGSYPSVCLYRAEHRRRAGRRRPAALCRQTAPPGGETGSYSTTWRGDGELQHHLAGRWGVTAPGPGGRSCNWNLCCDELFMYTQFIFTHIGVVCGCFNCRLQPKVGHSL